MPPIHSGDTGDGQGDDGDDDSVEFRPPLPPEDRIWRHPSEVAAADPTPRDRRGRTENRRTPRILGVAVVSGLIGATLSIGVVAALGGFSRETTVVERNVAVQPVTASAADDDTVAAIAARTGPATVALRIERDGVTSAGSAIVLRSDGHLVTNAHLVDGADAIEVRFHGGTAAEATTVGADPVTDVAVLHVEVDHVEPAVFGSADTVAVGDQAIALGAADADGWSPEVTTGIISSLDRRVRTPDGRVLHDMMIVDVRLAHSTAGGPLLDSTGAVVGMTSVAPAIDGDDGGDGDDAFCVATPVDIATHVARQIIDHGRARHVWLGVEGRDLPTDLADDLGLAGGALVSTVMAGSPAEGAGLADGDVIVDVDGEPVESMSGLIAALRTREPGEEVTVTVRRGDESMPVAVALAEKDRS